MDPALSDFYVTLLGATYMRDGHFFYMWSYTDRDELKTKLKAHRGENVPIVLYATRYGQIVLPARRWRHVLVTSSVFSLS